MERAKTESVGCDTSETCSYPPTRGSISNTISTEKHDDESTVSRLDDQLKLEFLEGSRDTFFKNHSPMRFSKPFHYGYFEDLVYVMMFDHSEGIRFTHSPSGGGKNKKENSTNPAWDFQFITPKYEVLKG